VHQAEPRDADDNANDCSENLPEGWDTRESDNGRQDVCVRCWDDYRARLETAASEWRAAAAVKMRDRKKEEKTT
jgi:hypothetical protein